MKNLMNKAFCSDNGHFHSVLDLPRLGAGSITEHTADTATDQQSTSGCTEGAQGVRNRRGFPSSSEVSEKFNGERR